MTETTLSTKLFRNWQFSQSIYKTLPNFPDYGMTRAKKMFLDF